MDTSTTEEDMDILMIKQEPEIKTEPEDYLASIPPSGNIFSVKFEDESEPTLEQQLPSNLPSAQQGNLDDELHDPDDETLNYTKLKIIEDCVNSTSGTEVVLEKPQDESISQSIFPERVGDASLQLPSTASRDSTETPQTVHQTVKPDSPKKKQPPRGKKHACQQCGAKFNRPGLLTQHMLSHSGLKPYSCPQCNSGFTRKHTLQIHLRTHSGEKPYSCSTCEARFTQLCHLRTHERSHTGERPYSCQICGSRFTKRYHVKIHERIHTGIKPHVCGECGASFNHPSHLKVHQRNHTGEKPYPCEHCDARFTQPANLRAHLKIHSDEKAFACPHCEARFHHSSHLTVHVRTHTGERPFTCSMCDAKFSQRGNLRSHEKIHSGIKPHACQVCDARFYEKRRLKQHELRHQKKPWRKSSGKKKTNSADDVDKQLAGNCEETKGEKDSEKEENGHFADGTNESPASQKKTRGKARRKKKAINNARDVCKPLSGSFDGQKKTKGKISSFFLPKAKEAPEKEEVQLSSLTDDTTPRNIDDSSQVHVAGSSDSSIIKKTLADEGSVEVNRLGCLDGASDAAQFHSLKVP